MKVIAIAFIVAAPLTWYVMQQWLQDNAYKINISWAAFTLTGTTIIAIALITISFQAIKAALANPVKSLRTQ